ncbi:PilZ domain-containing protein [Halobacillus mangrovi]|uniref:PilZ domain-containing protein n=1 Tax=Halobacillus mangrovi TaxID=402384 RepID=A0A1W5ZS46_9BACI|nr:PilZ domain-containing protein [Halobacillus mangrovi]ARI76103.1 PilZ domain-containing protein [Halobacillus mangrovi]
MLRERRNEPFRYTFSTPLPGFYNKKFNRQVAGALQVKDISLNGLRFSCDANPSLSMKDELILTFIYKNETFSAEGRVIWLKTDEDGMTCGIHVYEFPERMQAIIYQLGDTMNDSNKILG